MTRTMLVAAAVALAGCGSMDKSAPRIFAPPGLDPKNPKVFVVTNGATDCAQKISAIVVDQEPLYFFRAANPGAFPITWHLVTTGYSFVDQPSIADPTAIDSMTRKSAAGEIHSCRAGGRTMTCTNKNQNRGEWKYTLKVKADVTCGTIEDLDPTIAND